MLEGIPISLELVGVDNIKEVTITLVFIYNSLELILLFLSNIEYSSISIISRKLYSRLKRFKEVEEVNILIGRPIGA